MSGYSHLDEESPLTDGQSSMNEIGGAGEESGVNGDAEPDANGNGDKNTDGSYIDASLSLGTTENGVAEENLTPQTEVTVPKIEEKLEAHSKWWHTAMLLLADIVGSGVLGLPGAFARVGWVFGIILLVVCYPM